MIKSGITYYTDINMRPRFMMTHTTGFKNLFGVELFYESCDGSNNRKVVTLYYDTIEMARERMDLELSGNVGDPPGLKLSVAYIVLSSFMDTNKLDTVVIDISNSGYSFYDGIDENSYRSVL